MLRPMSVLSMALLQNSQLLSDPTRGAYLYKSCLDNVRSSSEPKPSESEIEWASHCIDYMKGIVDATGSLNAACYGKASFGTIVRAYLGYIHEHPALLGEDRSKGAMQAVLSAYPCPAKTT